MRKPIPDPYLNFITHGHATIATEDHDYMAIGCAKDAWERFLEHPIELKSRVRLERPDRPSTRGYRSEETKQGSLKEDFYWDRDSAVECEALCEEPSSGIDRRDIADFECAASRLLERMNFLVTAFAEFLEPALPGFRSLVSSTTHEHYLRFVREPFVEGTKEPRKGTTHVGLLVMHLTERNSVLRIRDKTRSRHWHSLDIGGPDENRVVVLAGDSLAEHHARVAVPVTNPCVLAGRTRTSISYIVPMVPTAVTA